MRFKSPIGVVVSQTFMEKVSKKSLSEKLEAHPDYPICLVFQIPWKISEYHAGHIRYHRLKLKSIHMKAYLIYIFLLLGIFPCRAQELTTASKELKASYLENRQRVLSNMKDQTSHLLFAARFRYRLHQELSNQYKKWERLYPKVVAIPVAMAEFDPENAISHLKQALKIDSANIDVLERLADQYRSTGDFISEVKYRKKIHRLAPSNATYAYNYVTAFSMIAPLKYRLKLAWLTEAYPDSPERIDALYQLYVSSSSQKDRKALFLEAYNTKHPKQAVKTGQYYFATNRFYELLDTNIDSAFFFSQKMISDKMQPQHYWKDKHRVAKSLCRANQLIQRDSSAKALSILDTLDLVADRWRIEHVKAENCIALMREEAMLKQGDYHQYLQAKLNAYSACPNKSLRTQLLNAGNRLGLDSIEIMKRVWNRRDSLSYLINDKGLIIFSRFGPLYREENKEILELMIKEMNDDWSTD